MIVPVVIIKYRVLSGECLAVEVSKLVDMNIYISASNSLVS